VEKTKRNDPNSGDGSECSVTATYDRIKQHNGSLFPLADPLKNELFSEQAKEIVIKLLDSQPEHRVSAEELLTSSWLAENLT
jgi:serine/threonine protein kinase